MKKRSAGGSSISVSFFMNGYREIHEESFEQSIEHV